MAGPRIFDYRAVFWVKSCLAVNSDSVQLCTEPSSTALEKLSYGHALESEWMRETSRAMEADSVQICTESKMSAKQNLTEKNLQVARAGTCPVSHVGHVSAHVAPRIPRCAEDRV
jgi:hypothetical protein